MEKKFIHQAFHVRLVIIAMNVLSIEVFAELTHIDEKIFTDNFFNLDFSLVIKMVPPGNNIYYTVIGAILEKENVRESVDSM